jgi:hypothetical protein
MVMLLCGLGVDRAQASLANRSGRTTVSCLAAQHHWRKLGVLQYLSHRGAFILRRERDHVGPDLDLRQVLLSIVVITYQAHDGIHYFPLGAAATGNRLFPEPQGVIRRLDQDITPVPQFLVWPISDPDRLVCGWVRVAKHLGPVQDAD